MLFKGRIIYSRDAAEVEQAAQELSDKIFSMKQHMNHIPLGFDIEWRPIFRKGIFCIIWGKIIIDCIYCVFMRHLFTYI